VNCSKDFKSFDELVAVADKMLYQAKETGRDKIVYYNHQ
jgi:PleD family two-component response regulator